MGLMVTIARGDAGQTMTLACERFDHKVQRLAHLSPVEKKRSSGEEPPYVSDWGSYQEFFYLHCVFTTGVLYEAAVQQVLNFWRNKGMDLTIGEAAEAAYITRECTFVSMDGDHNAGTNEWNMVLAMATGQYK